MAKLLVVIEGLDGSGKATQAKLLLDKLTADGTLVKGISFPDYNSASSALVKMYLSGEIGDAYDVNPYAATSFYAADRYISYRNYWGRWYEEGQTIIADRYTTSNLIYQLAKVDKGTQDEFIAWLEDYEYSKLELPKPTVVIYLDVAIDLSQGLMYQRYNGDVSKKDIHEKNLKFLSESREAAMYAADKLGWQIINCSPQGEILSVEEIQAKIYTIVEKYLI